MSAKPDRVPYRDREAVIREFCTCEWVFTDTPDGPARRALHNVDPNCKLHGPNAQPAPF